MGNYNQTSKTYQKITHVELKNHAGETLTPRALHSAIKKARLRDQSIEKDNRKLNDLSLILKKMSLAQGNFD